MKQYTDQEISIRMDVLLHLGFSCAAFGCYDRAERYLQDAERLTAGAPQDIVFWVDDFRRALAELRRVDPDRRDRFEAFLSLDGK